MSVSDTSSAGEKEQKPISIEQIEEVLGFRFQDWQREFIECKTMRQVLCCGRKSGKTQAAAAKIVIEAMEFPHGRTLITARTKGTAEELYQYVVKIVRLLEIPVEDRILATKLTLANFHKIELVSPGPTGYAIRPKSYTHIYTDEAAFMEDYVYTEAIFAGLAVHGVREVLMSTPNPMGAVGFFWDAFKTDKTAAVWHINSETQPHVSRVWLKQAKRIMLPDAYEREIRAQWGSVGNSFFPVWLIERSKYDGDPEEVARKADAVFIGVDFARFGSDDNALVWAAWLAEKKQCIIYRTEIVDSHQRLTHMVGRIISEVERNPKIVKVVTDEGGLGGGPTDALIERLGKNMVVGVNNLKRGNDIYGQRKTQKEDMYTTMRLAMEEGRFKFFSDSKTVKSLAQIRFSYTAEGDVTLKGKDDHITEAMVRASWLPLSGKLKGMGSVFLLRV